MLPMSYKAHLFICTNSPDRIGKCGSKNSEQLRQELKDRCKKEIGGDQIRINSAGCLGQCERGIAAVLYPSGQWFLDKTSTDGDEIFQVLKTSLKTDSD